MTYKIKQPKVKKKQSYIWEITYKDLDTGKTFIYSQQSTTKEKAIKIHKNFHPESEILKIELNKDTPTPEDVRALERAYIQGAKAGMRF